MSIVHWTRFAGVVAPHETDPLAEDGAEFYVRKASDGEVYAQPIHWRSPVATVGDLPDGPGLGDVRLVLDAHAIYVALGNPVAWSQLTTGGGGGGGSVQVFEFDTPSSEWVCTHNLGRLPAVTVYDLDGAIRPFVPITNPDMNTTVLEPSPPLAGKVVLV